MENGNEVGLRAGDQSFTTSSIVKLNANMLHGALVFRAADLRAGIASPWRRLARDCANGLWPAEVAIFMPIKEI